jgi:hypothetical protein
MIKRKRAKPYDPAEAERIRQEREAHREMAEAIVVETANDHHTPDQGAAA